MEFMLRPKSEVGETILVEGVLEWDSPSWVGFQFSNPWNWDRSLPRVRSLFSKVII
jgi:hypothetical protein